MVRKAPQGECEGDDQYKHVVAQLTPKLRIIAPPDEIQWIIQRRTINNGIGQWHSKAYCATKEGLTKAISPYQLTTEAKTIIDALPAHFPRNPTT